MLSRPWIAVASGVIRHPSRAKQAAAASKSPALTARGKERQAFPGPGRGGLAFAIFTLVRLTRNSGAGKLGRSTEEDVMRKAMTLGVVVLLVAIAAVGLAVAKGKRPKPTVVQAGNMVLGINGDVTPHALPRHDLAPMGVWGSGSLSTLDGSHPPALEQASFDADKDAFVGVEGLPACRL